MPVGDVETYYRDGSWRNTLHGSTSALDSHSTQSEAVEKARLYVWIYLTLAADSRGRCEHIVRNADGTIASRSLYPV